MSNEAFNPEQEEDEDEDGVEENEQNPPPDSPGKIKKTIFFAKMENGPVAVDTMRKAIISGEIIGEALEQLSSISQSIYKPLLCGSPNKTQPSQESPFLGSGADATCPVAIPREVSEKFQSFASDLFVTVGEVH